MEAYTEIARDASTVTMRALAPTTIELVENVSAAMFSVGYDRGAIPPTYSRPLVAPGDTLRELIGAWLAELLELSRREDIVFSQATVDRLEPGGVQGSASGSYRSDVSRAGPVVVAVASVGPVVDIPEGHWLDVILETDGGLQAV